MKRRKIHIILPLAALVVALVAMATAAVAGNQKQPLTAEEQYAFAKDAVLYVRSYYASGSVKATGSGFVVTQDGMAVTAAHVVDKAARVTMLTADGRELDAAVLSCDTVSDVAVLRLPKGRYSAVNVASAAPNGGAVLRAMGYPIKGTLIITEGLCSAPEATVSEKQRALVTCDIVNGMSGGPVFDRFGAVAGLCSGSVRTMSGIHLSARWEDINQAVKTAKEAAK